LIAPNADNEKGHWESRVITDLNDAILAAGDSDWKDWRNSSTTRSTLWRSTLCTRARKQR